MSKHTKRFITLILTAFALFLVACGNGGGGGGDAVTTPPTGNGTGNGDESPDAVLTVGVSMPTRSLQRWNQDGENIEASLQALGFNVDLQFAGENEVPLQVSQLENMIAQGVDVLVIAAVDGESLTEVLAQAYNNNIPVIAYDRLIMGTPAVTYYATFDNWLVGQMQGMFVRDQLGLSTNPGPFYVEFFTGDPGDNNIHFFFGGAMDILQPYLDDGTLVVLSGQTEIMQVATPGWSTEAAQNRMENLISISNYSPTGQRLDAVVASNDSTAQGATNALLNAGFTAENFPIVTGQDADIISVINLVAGHQAMTVFKDTRLLADQVALMVESILQGHEPPINNTTDYHNGIGYIPTYLVEPVLLTIENYRELLIYSGYYTEDQIYVN